MPKSTKPNRKSRRGFLTRAAVGAAAGRIAKPPIASGGIALAVEGSGNKRQGADLTMVVRNPSSSGMLPHRAKVMSDQELLDVYSYIQTFPAPQPASEIPLLKD